MFGDFIARFGDLSNKRHDIVSKATTDWRGFVTLGSCFSSAARAAYARIDTIKDAMQLASQRAW